MTTEVLEGGRRIDDNGIIMPWYTSPCLEWLENLDLKDKRVWEYGAGDSTFWYRYKGADSAGVDHDPKYTRPNLDRIYLADNEREYIQSDERGGRWDFVIVDGLYRDQCGYNALGRLKSGGYLILDNYKQETVEPNWPLTDKLIEGMPITFYFEPNHWDKWCTAVIQKP